MIVNSKRPRHHSRLLPSTLFFIIVELSSCFLYGGITTPNARCSDVESCHQQSSCLFAANISVERYQHKDFTLTYLYKKASHGRENDDPIVMIHPVGVGLSSWFWTRVMESYENNPPMYAPDLIGCGLDHGADPWDPEKVTGIYYTWIYRNS